MNALNRVRAGVAVVVVAVAVVGGAPRVAMAQTIFFEEGFENSAMESRGWYDNSGLQVTAAEHRATGASAGWFHFPKGGRTPSPGGAIRHKFPASDEIYIGYWVKYSANWEGSNKPYHPHEFHVVTNLDNEYVGPAYTHLTLYIEENEGRPQLGIQDGANIDETRIGQDLTAVTEHRSVAGCNGDSDGSGDGDCYVSGTMHYNGKLWKAPGVMFTDTAGAYYKNDWHHVEAYFKLNSIAGGKGIADGIVRYWYDGALVFDHPNVMLRTGQYPTMQFNQFLIAPYIGDGSPVDQTMWVDDLVVASSRPVAAVAEASAAEAGTLTVYPNPTQTTLTLSLNVPRRTSATLELCDLLGRTVLARHCELDAGDQSIPIDISGIAAGAYLCRVATASGTRRAVIRVVR